MAEIDVNPVQLEILKNALAAIADEMALTVLRTGHSTIIKDGGDFSTALISAQGELLTQSLTIPQHLGSMPDALISVMRHFGDRIEPGDIFMMNDPYNGGMHLQDLFVFKPIFTPGTDRPIAFAAAVAHHTDMGGRVPGSNASDSTEIYQEGIRFPILKLHEAGKPVTAVFDILAANVRVPQMVLGDLSATIAACFYGEREFMKLVARNGAEWMRTYLVALLDYTEKLTRAEIAALPQGTYTFEDWIDDDAPIPLRVKLTIRSGQVIADYTGSAPQVRGALNATESYTKACTYLSLRCALESDIPSNGGFMRAITVIAPQGTILNVKKPGACAARGLTGFRLVDVVIGALTQAIPERLMAASEGGNTFMTIGGHDPKRGPFVHCDMVFGAWGGSRYRGDGDAMPMIAANCTNIPIEVIESTYPLRCEQYGFVADTGGAGESRGGLSIVRDLRLTAGEAILQVRSDRRRFMPWPLAGGEPGTPSWNYIDPTPGSDPLPSKVTMEFKAGAVFRHVTGGGGGYGPPWRRDPQLVADDVRNEKISRARAQERYGVVLEPGTFEVDRSRTDQARAALRRGARTS